MILFTYSVISKTLTWYWGLDAHSWLELSLFRGDIGRLARAIGTMQPGAVLSKRITRGLLSRPYCQSWTSREELITGSSSINITAKYSLNFRSTYCSPKSQYGCWPLQGSKSRTTAYVFCFWVSQLLGSCSKCEKIDTMIPQVPWGPKFGLWRFSLSRVWKRELPC